MPTALRNEISAIALEGQDHAGARQLFDDRWRRRSVALMSGDTNQSAQLLLAPLHYLRAAWNPMPNSTSRNPTSNSTRKWMLASPCLVLVDVGAMDEAQTEKLTPGSIAAVFLCALQAPRLAAAQDDLLPVTLRQGDRALGSSLSWETPQGLQAFPETSPSLASCRTLP